MALVTHKQKPFTMKKIIALFVLMLAFGLNANAQQKKAPQAAATTTAQNPAEQTIKQAAVKDLTAMMQVVELEATKQQDFLGLFEYKHRLLQEDLSAERKAILAETIEAKMRAGLNSDQMAKLSQSPALLKKLTH